MPEVKLGKIDASTEKHPELELNITTRLQDSLAETSTLDCAIRFGDGDWDGRDSSLLIQERRIAVRADDTRARGVRRALTSIA